MIDFGASLKKQAEVGKIFERYAIKESDIEKNLYVCRAKADRMSIKRLRSSI
ncbi:MAG: hypothetical protein LBS61_01750 [Endomicrobium sp.]|jgi:hypothetical protein|nr:hypothetical protein [Endomicrobium sp.]